MRHFDIIKWILLAATLYAFGETYLTYTGRDGVREACVGYALLAVLCVCLLIRRLITLHYLHMPLRKIDRLDGRKFEKYLSVQFRHLGYRVTLTAASHDYGADLILKRWGKKTIVQAKRYKKNVGIAAVQEAVAAIAYYEADRAMVVTNSGFTKSARELAAQNEVELWGRREIMHKFKLRD